MFCLQQTFTRVLCIFFALVPFFLTSSSYASDKVTLQLRWLHQFQFAGYYAAQEKGFYKEAGLDVTIIAGGPERIAVDEVLEGRAQYAVASQEILLGRLQGKPLVALAAILQHSPAIFLAREDSGIKTPMDLIGRNVMTIGGFSDVGILTMLRSEGVDPEQVKIQTSSFDINDLVEGKVDVFNSYLSNEPYFMEKKGIAFTVLNPTAYGVDFYSDVLFTSENEIKNNPDRVRKFREASLKGWQYAIENHEEVIDIILSKYGSVKTRNHLRYEADILHKLVKPKGIPLGYMSLVRWKHMADIFVREGFLESDYSLEGLMYNPVEAKPIVFLGDSNFPPYEFLDNGKPAGANIEFLESLKTEMGRPIEIRLYPSAELKARLSNGEGHALSLVTINDNHTNDSDFTQATFIFKYDLFVKDNRIHEFNNDDWSHKRIAVKLVGPSQSILKTRHPEAKMIVVESTLEGMQKLLNGEVDGVIEDRLSGLFILNREKINGISTLAKPISTQTSHIQLMKGNALLLDEISHAISHIKFKGVFNKISQHWAGTTIDQSAHIIVGSELDYAPFALADNNGRADGFTVDLMKAVCEVMGIKVTFRVGPWSEVRKALEDGEVSALPLVSYSAEREKVFDFTAPHTVSYAAVFKRIDTPSIDTTDELSGKAIVTMHSDATHDWLIQNMVSENVVLTKTVRESLQLLASGKQDYALAPRLVGLLTAKDLGLSNIEVTGPRINVYGRGYGFAVREGDTQLLARLNQGLSIVKETGRYDKIYEKWFGTVDPKGISQEDLTRYLFWGGFAAIILIGVPLLWSVSLRRTVGRRTAELNNEIFEHERAEEILRDTTVKLENANQAKTEFMATMSHELRTPLNAILGFSEMIHSQYLGPLGNGKYEEYANDIHYSGEQLLSLINDMLDVAAIEAGKKTFDKEEVNVCKIIKECVISMEPAVLEKGLTLVFEPLNICPLIYADRRAVAQIILNILSNSSKYTECGGTITVRVDIMDENIAIKVIDTGIGIPKETLPNITDPFNHTLFSEPYRTKGGTGLGLSIVKSLVEFHKGSLDIQSELGVGTTVTVTLPKHGKDDN